MNIIAQRKKKTHFDTKFQKSKWVLVKARKPEAWENEP